MTNRTSARHDDSGLGLIELIVVIVVTGIIMAAIVSIFVNSWKTQDQVTSETGGTNRGQVVGSMIEQAVRNSLYLSVNSAGDELRVRTSLSGSALKCQGFKVASTGVQIATSSTSIGTTWPAWQPAIKIVGSAPYFTLTNGVLSYSFDVQTESAPVRISGDVAVRSDQETGNGGCW
ncbi:prepilin-type N-terminal cleavage/methylation domain-containing protein [Microbacterium sp. BK668]|uniref:prepilin-type N-terminal cleavage/methylation domain-containing protein n=1 Tax=Microbacterium sp. BK668 TaxID=2512118 RepID=UPI00105C8DD2|nr:prepilin-type N-terminal cleavage/methylation domain-containing protein [Microbacterium sp. BK668]TDN93234.1 pilin/secretion family protein with methylation motif [Microbacterium sp. BK668]